MISFRKCLPAGLLLLAVIISLAACTPEKEPVPILPLPAEFKPLLQLDDEGALKALPIPFVDFTKGQSETKLWEANYASKVKDESETELFVETGDPNALNPFRGYTFELGVLKKSAIWVKNELVFAPNTENLLPSVEKCLAAAGYEQKADLKASITHSYVNEKERILLTITAVKENYSAFTYTTYIEDSFTPGNNFKEWLQFDDKGELSKVPIPFADFTKGKAEVKAWEEGYGSTLYEEGDTKLFYNTNDPKQLNPKRFYQFDSQELLWANSYAIATKLVFDVTQEQPVINKSFLAVLQAEGYKLEEGEERPTYSNGTYSISLDYSPYNRALALVVIMASIREPESPNFNPEAQDFPLFLPDKYIKDYDEIAIREYETKVGRTYNEQQSKPGEKLVFSPLAGDNRVNLQLVTYERRDGTYENGTPKVASIICLSNNITSEEMLARPEVKQYITAQGFTFEKKIPGESAIYVYKAPKIGFGLYVSVLGNNTTVWIFTKTSIVEKENPNPEELRKPWYLPLFKWGATISENSPLIDDEKGRGFTAEYKLADPEGTPVPRCNRIESQPPHDSDYAFGGSKAGVAFFVYGDDKGSANPGTVETISIGFNDKFQRDKRNYQDEELKQFFISEGFEYKGEGSLSLFKFREYYHPGQKVYLQIATGSGFTFGTFTYLEEWTKTTVDQARAKAALQYGL